MCAVRFAKQVVPSELTGAAADLFTVKGVCSSTPLEKVGTGSEKHMGIMLARNWCAPPSFDSWFCCCFQKDAAESSYRVDRRRSRDRTFEPRPRDRHVTIEILHGLNLTRLNGMACTRPIIRNLARGRDASLVLS